MSILDAMTTSTQGMSAQATRLGVTANNTANVNTRGYQRLATGLSTLTGGATGGVEATVSQTTGQDTASSTDTSNVDLQTEMTGSVETKLGFAVNAGAFETGADMWGVLMSMKRD